MTIQSIEIAERGSCAGGESFGASGPYDQLRGKVTFSIDPLHAANSTIVDIELAPRSADGRVVFCADLLIQTPSNPARSNGCLLTEAPNRGNRLFAGSFHRVPVMNPADRDLPGDGYLYRQGFTLVSIGWQWDAHGEGAMALDPPHAMKDGRDIPGQVILEFRPDSDRPFLSILQLGQSQPSFPVDEPDDPGYCLYEKDFEDDEARLIPRSDWRFARLRDGHIEPSDRHVLHDAGFRKGRIYELTYTTIRAPIAGTGLIALRDLATCLRYGDGHSPLSRPFQHNIAFGVSQTGRLLRHFLYAGLNLDEEGRVAYDGMLIHIARGQRGDFNHRYAQPTTAGIPGFGQRFPFAMTTEPDPFTGARDHLVSRLEESEVPGAVPKIFFTNTSFEYWRGDACLLHTSPDGERDLTGHPRARIYHYAGTHHINGLLINGRQIRQLPTGSSTSQGMNVVNFSPLLRASLARLYAWVSANEEPPVERFPRLSDGTACNRAEVQSSFERLPWIARLAPDKLPVLRSLDLGPRQDEGVGRYPAIEQGVYPALVSAVNHDLNELAGIRLPDLECPLGTHTGWNTRDEAIGGADLPAAFAGFTEFFAATAELRTNRGDPRLSVQERYAGRDDYAAQAAITTDRLIREGYLLSEDREWVIGNCLNQYDIVALSIAGK